MSRSFDARVRCPKCSVESAFTIWESINVTIDPQLKSRLLQGNLTTLCCNNCGTESDVHFDCLYHDMEKSIAIWLKNADDEEFNTAKQMFSISTEIKTCRTVRTIHELYDKIRIFDDGLDDFEIELFKFLVCARREWD